MPLYVAQILNGANYAFTMIFVLEMSIKLVGLGVKDYISDSFNVFDGIITILSVIEMGVELSGKSFAAISAFRAARILRLFRLSGSLTSILMIMLGSIVSAMWIAFLLILYLFIIGLLGGIVSQTLVLSIHCCPHNPHSPFSSLATNSTLALLRDQSSFVLLGSR